MGNQGWIHLHRKIQECVIWENEEKFDCRSAWIDLLLLANHEDKKVMFDRKPITVKKGQRITSIRFLAERWHWSVDRTSRYLKMLENEKMITRESDNRRTLLTIVNYSVYNDMPNTDKDTDKDTSRTLTSTQTEHQQVTNKNDKNDKNEENDKKDNTPLNPPEGKKKREKKSNVVLLNEIFESKPGAKAQLSEEVVEVMIEWVEYKDQKKQHYVEKGLIEQLNKAYRSEKQYGASAVVECVRTSMANNYQGIIWDSLERNGAKKKDDRLSFWED